MLFTAQTRQSYDHRLRDLVRSAGDISVATRLGIPRSTAYGWLSTNQFEVVTFEVANMDLVLLQREVLVLRKRIEWPIALLRSMIVLLKVTRISLNDTRPSDGSSKTLLLEAIERSRTILPLRSVLRVLGLSQSRYHSWKREEECGLDDMPSWCSGPAIVAPLPFARNSLPRKPLCCLRCSKEAEWQNTGIRPRSRYREAGLSMQSPPCCTSSH